MADAALSSEYSAYEDDRGEDSSDNEEETTRGRRARSELQQSYPVTRGRRRWPGLRPGATLKRRPRRKTVYDAFIEPSKNTPHYVKEDSQDNLLTRTRLRILRGVESAVVRVLSLLVLVVFLVLVIVELALVQDRLPPPAEAIIEIFTLLFAAFFCGEVALRIVGQGKVFFCKSFEVVDLVVIVLATVMTVAYVIVDDHLINSAVNIGVSVTRLIVIGRVVRIFFWAKVLYEQRTLKRYIRSKVSQNKRRYMKDGYDLDLTYVTDRVIAMSFPSSGSESLYRNSIQEVGNFLDHMHFGHYRVYNLCSEKEYDTSYFHHQVQRIHIDDHNVPKFTDLVDFCEDAFTWMDGNTENIIVVHCKGGKGRTGTMISAWLVRSGLFEQAGESLAYFSDRRTDKAKGKKSQGVQTPSQSRYVNYYEQLILKMAGNLPPPVSMRIKRVTVYGLNKVGKGDATDWSFKVYYNETVFEVSFLEPDFERVQVINDGVSDIVHVFISESDPLLVTDDVKFKFFCSTKSVPTANDKCQFYFWFHTTFIENNKLLLNRANLDNLQKSKNRRVYPLNFAVEIEFEPCDSLRPSLTQTRRLVD